MDRSRFDRYLEPPPQLIPAPEAPPHLGGLMLAPYRGVLPDEIEPFPVAALEGAFDDAQARELMKCALSSPKARERLARGRHMPIGISRRGEVAKGEPRSYLAVAYDYGAETTVEISLDGEGQVREVAERRYQPPLVQAEIDRAIELARADERLLTRLEGLQAMAIPFAGLDNEFAERRVVEVLFGCRSERLPKYRAWIDLARESVLHAGSSCECCRKPGEERS